MFISTWGTFLCLQTIIVDVGDQVLKLIVKEN